MLGQLCKLQNKINKFSKLTLIEITYRRKLFNTLGVNIILEHQGALIRVLTLKMNGL